MEGGAERKIGFVPRAFVELPGPQPQPELEPEPEPEPEPEARPG